jgi:hypothetical protein
MTALQIVVTQEAIEITLDIIDADVAGLSALHA